MRLQPSTSRCHHLVSQQRYDAQPQGLCRFPRQTAQAAQAAQAAQPAAVQQAAVPQAAVQAAAVQAVEATERDALSQGVKVLWSSPKRDCLAGDNAGAAVAVAVSGAKRVRGASPPPQGATPPYDDPLLVAETPTTASAFDDF